ncbi:glycosyltransferase family 2 protein [Robertkochia sediminum]|uniref:glycosyltransferase family 2 protein n=1 Tax=Robertkochia sediminum TaxID=2785326 RepID=UPI0019334ABF|nr:glycosyltransferase family 2 protein [Robertkochia sediminum]MBL7473742.1 glycosyltransferase family 2 protein [Robertkochia sediminum]
MENELTIAICAYNCENYIKETLSCLINQTYKKFNLLIINDCSTDNSVEVIRNFLSEKNFNYELVNFKINRGLAAGRAYIEQKVNTKYILFIDADDCPYPTLVEKLYNKISEDKDIIAVGCYHEFIDSKGAEISGGIYIGAKTKEEFYKKAGKEKLIFMQPTAIIDREALLSVGGRSIEGYPEGKPRYQDLCEDLDLWTRMSDLYEEGKAILVVPQVLCKYRKHEMALSANSFGMLLRMRHIKTNLRRRRSGQTELTFIEFYKNIEEKEIKVLQKKALSADLVRNSFYALKKREYFRFLKSLFHVSVSDPIYLLDKIKNNSGFIK